jgi:endonuclease/exonuclease/phosphatase (EEP) superfamily protein YafD
MNVVLLVLAASWLVFVVLHRLLTGRYWLWLLPDVLPPVSYLAVPLVFVAVSVPTGQYWAAGAAAAALVLGAGHSGLNLRRPGRTSSSGVSVLAWNTQYWNQGNGNLYDFLKSKNADIYVLQERLHGSHYHPLPAPDLAQLHEEFPDHHIAAVGELITLSRFPIIETHPRSGTQWPAEYHATKVLRTDLRLGTDVLSVYNVHIPVQYVGTDNVLSREFYTRLRDRNRTRKAQFESLSADVRANQNMVLVTGDFNSTGAMGDLTWLFRNLTCANRAGRGLLPATWPARGLPLWQLDWTFTRGVRVERYELGDPQGISDHRTQELLILPGDTRGRTQAPTQVSTRANQ